MKTSLVCGAVGFIGGHLVIRLKKEGYWVRGVDLKRHEYVWPSPAADFVIGDFRDLAICRNVADRLFDEVNQVAADMCGAGFIFSSENDADIMHNSALINLNMLEATYKAGVKKNFYSSSACMYQEYN